MPGGRLHISNIKIDSLIPYEFNNKIHSEEQINHIANSIKEFGFLQPIVIDKNNVIVAGHGRREAAKKLGMEEIPIILADTLTATQIKKYRILDNKLSDMAEWNLDNIKLELEELQDDELNELFPDIDLDDNYNEDIEDDIPEDPVNIVVEEGDIFQLGEHRLMCGDSCDIEVVERLMDGNTIDTVYTDPPYGISYSGKGQQGAAKGNDFGQILGDGSVDIAKDAYGVIMILQPKHLYYWGANFYTSVLEDGNSWIVWNKKTIGNNYSDCELCYTNKKGRIKMFEHQRHGMIKESERGQRRVHPTQKPIALAEYCLGLEYNDNILDLFGGSGSTLIACEKTKRKCYMMELDPKYIQVIIKRYHKYTEGKKEIECLNRALDINQIIHD